MPSKTTASDIAGIIRTIRIIAKHMKTSDSAFSSFTEISESIRLVCDASAVAIYSRRYTDRQSFLFQCLAATARQSPIGHEFTPTFQRHAIGGHLWELLCTPDPVFIKSNPTKDEFPAPVYLQPVFMEGEPFGFIMVQEPGCEDHEVESMTEIIAVIADILEMGLARVNLMARLDQIFNAFPLPTIIIAADETLAAWNKANEDMTGVRSEDIVGQQRYAYALPYYGKERPLIPNLIMNPDPKWQATYHEYVQEGNQVKGLAFCPTLPGGPTYIGSSTSKLFDLNDRLYGAMHTVRDITHEREMSADLQRSETMYRAIADFAGVGILLVKDREIIYSNEQIEGFVEQSGKIVSYDDFVNWVRLENYPDIQALIDRLFRADGPLRFTFRARRNSEMCYFNALAQLITYENEHVVYFVIDDVTEQRELDRRARLNEMKLFHEERLTSLGMMAAGIAHELNQPLNTIRVITDGFLYCDEKGWGMDRDELRENIEMISKQVVRMSTVIQNIRNFAREDQSHDFIEINLNDAIGTVFSMIGRQMEAHNIKVDRFLARDLPPIMAPSNQLEQVVTNLLINARQAFDFCGHADREISVRTYCQNNSVILEVSDNATGVAEEHLEKVFYPFFTTKQIGKGTGLGLSICQSIIASMKGLITVSNNSRGGATFLVSIPRQEILHEYSRDR